MNPLVFQEFENILSERDVGECVLEIGAVPTRESLLNLKALRHVREKIGINLDGGEAFRSEMIIRRPETCDFVPDYEIVEGNANSMSCFSDNCFDTVLCNAVLEHDKYFWRTVSEIRRVARPGGIIVVGAPGFDAIENIQPSSYDRESLTGIEEMRRRMLGEPVLPIHGFPSDYYRFSPEAFREVIFEGLREVKVYSILLPPRIIGVGIKVE